ncbi:MAG: hypothetical protein RR495_02815 [Anaerovoracaceae bacterium]
MVVNYYQNTTATKDKALKISEGRDVVASGITGISDISVKPGGTYSFDLEDLKAQAKITGAGAVDSIAYSGGTLTLYGKDTKNVPYTLGTIEIYKVNNGTDTRENLTGSVAGKTLTLNFTKPVTGEEKYKVVFKGDKGHLTDKNGWDYESSSSFSGHVKSYNHTEFAALNDTISLTAGGVLTISDLTPGTSVSTDKGKFGTDGTVMLYSKATTSSSYSDIEQGTANGTTLTYSTDTAKSYRLNITVPTGTNKVDVWINGVKETLTNPLGSGGSNHFTRELKATEIKGNCDISVKDSPAAKIEYTQPVGARVFDTVDLKPYIIGDNGYTFRIKEVKAENQDEKPTTSLVDINANNTIKLKNVGIAYLKIEAYKNGVVDNNKATRVSFNINKAIQRITVNSSFQVTPNNGVYLGAKALGGAKLSYRSNTAGITVDANGYVRAITGANGTITITAEATDFYDATSTNVTITTSASSLYGSISVSGLAKVGYSLSVDTSKIMPVEARNNIRYEWYRPGTTGVISTSQTYYVSSLDVDKTLEVRVIGMNGYVGTLSTSKFIDNGKPVITSQPASAKYFLGADMSTLTVASTSSSTSLTRYQWYKNNVAIVGATGTSYKPSRDGYGGDSYKCVVTNSEGSTTTNIADIVVVREVGKIKHGKSSASTKSIRIKWAKADNAHRYIVYRATSKTGEYKQVKVVKGTEFKDTGLSKNKNYYYKVKAYRNDKFNGVTYKTYGDLSARKTVKTDKY